MSGLSISHLSAPATVREQLAADVRAGLLEPPRSLAPKYFYDARGSELFEEITRLPEYYPTRAETEILVRHAAELVAAVGPEEVFELGSGSSRKTRLLLEAMREQGSGDRYTALDVSEDALAQAGSALTADYPWLAFTGLVGDFHTDLGRVPGNPPGSSRRLVAFLGSTIGNLEPGERAAFLRQVAALLEPGDGFLLGVDLVKDAGTLEAAYDDAAGVTAAFNLNVLAVVNREMDGDIPLDAFEHVALYDKERARVEMRLRATRPLQARLAAIGTTMTLAEGEEIRTEISAKFTRDGIESELAAAGLHLDRWLTDSKDRFALLLASSYSAAMRVSTRRSVT